MQRQPAQLRGSRLLLFRNGSLPAVLLINTLSVLNTALLKRIPPTARGRRLCWRTGQSMSEGYTIDGNGDEVAGIVVRLEGERGFRFHAAASGFDALDGHVFVTAAAAREFARGRPQRRTGLGLGGAA